MISRSELVRKRKLWRAEPSNLTRHVQGVLQVTRQLQSLQGLKVPKNVSSVHLVRTSPLQDGQSEIKGCRFFQAGDKT